MLKETMLPLYQRELFIYRIINRYLKYKDNLRIYQPSSEVLYESQILYKEVYYEALEHGILSDDEILQIMYQNGDWDSYNEDQLVKVLPKHVEFFQKEIYNNFGDEKQVNQINLYLNRAREEIVRLHNKRNLYNHLSAEGVASFAKIQYILALSTFDGKESCDLEKYDIKDIMSFYYNQLIDNTTMRYLARTSPWRDIWYSSKKNGNLFKVTATELSEEQHQIIYWSNLYDIIRELEDCPKDNIINYDDALDGWLLIRQDKINKNNNLSEAEQLAGNNRNAHEIFLVAKQDSNDTNDTRLSKEEIYALNDPSSRAIVKNRLETIQKKGAVSDVEFADVQTRLRIQQTQAEMGR